MFNVSQFRELIVKSSLEDLKLYSKEAEELLLFTCAVESDGGTFLKQVNGQALGIYQMELLTYNDLWQNYIKSEPSLSLKFYTNFNINFMPPEERLIYDLRFSTAMTRIFYLTINQPLPNASDENAIWEYYKTHYNTNLGKANKEKSLFKYHNFLHN